MELTQQSWRWKLKTERKNQCGCRQTDSHNPCHYSAVKYRREEHPDTSAQVCGNRFMHRRGRTDDEEDEAGEDQEAGKCCQPADQSSRAPTRQATNEQRQTQRNIQPPISVCIHGSASPRQFEGTMPFLLPQPSSAQYGVRYAIHSRQMQLQVPSASLRTGSSTALFANCANNSAQDDKNLGLGERKNRRATANVEAGPPPGRRMTAKKTKTIDQRMPL